MRFVLIFSLALGGCATTQAFPIDSQLICARGKVAIVSEAAGEALVLPIDCDKGKQI